MSRELNWVFDHNVALANSTTERIIGQALFYYVKNNLVALGGWEVIGSSDGIGGNWEYQGVTGGGPYAGGSTGAYDVWTATTDIPFAADGSSPAWAVLKGPTWEGVTPYLILAYEGTVDTHMYFAGCAEKPVLVSAAAAYIPVAPAGDVEFVEKRRTRWFYSNGEIRSQLSICTDNGSFILVTDRVASANLNGMMGFLRMRPTHTQPTFALTSGNASTFSSVSTQWWTAWSPTPQTWNDDISPLIVDSTSVHWAAPTRAAGTNIMVTDLNTVNCFGKVEPFPFYLTTVHSLGNIEHKHGFLGRVPDVFVAPYGLADGDTVGDGGTEYYVCGYFLFPGNDTPLVGP